MARKVFINENNTATLVCPECSKATTIDVSKYKDLQRLVTLKVICKCKKPFSVTLERRRHFRKPVDLKGKYEYRPSGRPASRGTLSVLNVSRSGLKMKFNQLPELEAGVRLNVEFTLDDKHNSLIRKEVVVRGIKNNEVGAEFCSFDASDPSDKALGFYLFS